MGTAHIEGAASNLLKLKYKVSKETGEPSFLAIMTAAGGLTYTRLDGICVIPADCLGRDVHKFR